MRTLIACGVFRNEIERLRQDLGVDLQVNYLDPGLHVSFDDLEAALKMELERSRGSKIIVAFGACHPRMKDILAPYGAVMLDCQNCIDAFITRDEVERRAADGLYFYLSPGWIECWRDIFSRMGWGIDEARLEMGCFKGAVFIDTLANSPEYEEELMEFLDFTLLSWTVLPVSLEHFRSLIMKSLELLED